MPTASFTLDPRRGMLRIGMVAEARVTMVPSLRHKGSVNRALGGMAIGAGRQVARRRVAEAVDRRNQQKGQLDVPDSGCGDRRGLYYAMGSLTQPVAEIQRGPAEECL